MAPPVSPHFHCLMLDQTILYSGLVSPLSSVVVKKKRISQYVQVITTELPERGGFLSSLTPLSQNLDQTKSGRKK